MLTKLGGNKNIIKNNIEESVIIRYNGIKKDKKVNNKS